MSDGDFVLLAVWLMFAVLALIAVLEWMKR